MEIGPEPGGRWQQAGGQVDTQVMGWQQERGPWSI